MRTTTVRYNNLPDLMGFVRINESVGFVVRQILQTNGGEYIVVYEFTDPVTPYDLQTKDAA